MSCWSRSGRRPRRAPSASARRCRRWCCRAASQLAVEAWDWRYYAEKVRQARYDLDEAAVKPYFPLERMVEAVFDCAHRLFGLRFVHAPQVQAYHPDVKVYEVRDAAGALIGVFLHDNFARAEQAQRRLDEFVPPAVAQCGQRGSWRRSRWSSTTTTSRKGAPGEPTLLSFDDARTLFHEFGHGLHGLLSNVTYERLSGTNVLRDFVELPSQLFEHWLDEPEVLKRHARHHLTGEPIPDALIAQAARRAALQPGLRDGALHRLGAGRHGRARARRSTRAATSSRSSAPSCSASACRRGSG